jgi:hypothetical protein
MTTDKPSLRELAAARAADREPEALPEVPEPRAAVPRQGLRRGKERAALYAENLADLAAAIALGPGTRSLHTRMQAAQVLWGMMQLMPDSVPVLPEAEGEEPG